MKTLITFAFLLITLCSFSQQSFLRLGVGTSTAKNPEVDKHYKTLGCYYGVEIKKGAVYGLVEVGSRLHLTMDAVVDILGVNAGAGIKYERWFTELKVGYAFVFNAPVGDVHKVGDTMIVLSPGYDRPCFFTPSYSIQYGRKVLGEWIYIEGNYAGKELWGSIGLKILF